MDLLLENGVKIIKQLKAAGFEAYFVGGIVRDRLLNRKIHDVDIATNATTTEVIDLFPATIPVGMKHGTVIVRINNHSYEVSTFRGNGTLCSDLAHRDFTINALAFTENLELIDPYYFQEDLKAKVIRAVRNPVERFLEDPLRMLRGVRFVSELGFAIEKETKIAIEQYRHLFATVAKERIVVEFEKILQSENYVEGFQLLLSTNLYEKIPFLAKEAHVLTKLCSLSLNQLRSIEEKWAALFYWKNDSAFHSLPMANKQKKEIKTLLNGLSYIEQYGWDDYFLFLHGIMLAKKILRLQQVIFGRTTTTEQLLEEMFDQLPIQSPSDLKITGKDLISHLQREPGPWVKQCLEQMEKAVVQRKVSNQKNELLQWIDSKFKMEGGGASERKVSRYADE